MNQGLEMKINRLPVPTWNWLRMNESRIVQKAADSECEIRCRIPDFIDEIEENTKYMKQMDTVLTGLGEDMDLLAEHSNAAQRMFVIRKNQNQEAMKPEALKPEALKPEAIKPDLLKLDFYYADKDEKLNTIGIYAKEGSRAVVIMDYSSLKSSSGTASIQTKIFAEKGADVQLIQIQRLGEGFRCLNDVGGSCREGAKIEVIQLVLGGKDTYQGSRIELAGKESVLDAKIGYLLKKNQRLDMNYTALHTGEKTQSAITALGVLRGESQKLFRGTIDFQKGASKATGEEKEDILLLDDHVVNRTIPLILCAEEDVQGSHGATIGQLDEALLFYMQSRGMETEEIYEMMARARIDALCRLIPDEETRTRLENYLEEEQEKAKGEWENDGSRDN